MPAGATELGGVDAVLLGTEDVSPLGRGSGDGASGCLSEQCVSIPTSSDAHTVVVRRRGRDMTFQALSSSNSPAGPVLKLGVGIPTALSTVANILLLLPLVPSTPPMSAVLPSIRIDCPCLK